MTDFGYRTTALEAIAGIDLAGKSAIVSGGYSGIGLESARALASAGAQVTIACRELPRAEQAAAELNQSVGAPRVTAAQIDLSSLASVRAFADQFLQAHPQLHLLINNAAVMACPLNYTADGFEMQFGTNHLGHFVLFQQLLPALQAAKGARVVCLSSTGHILSPVVFADIDFKQRAYQPWLSYGQAKSANALMAVGIQMRYANEDIEAFAVHPGGIMTSLQRHMSTAEIRERGWVDENGKVNERFKTVEQGASTSIWAATAPALAGKGGQYLEDCAPAVIHDAIPASRTGVMRYAVDPANADKLWELSLKLTAT
jgi:NAD(P)-dependent dehydrogenase (short-subunit alcohol dehydrogenase family)